MLPDPGTFGHIWTGSTSPDDRLKDGGQAVEITRVDFGRRCSSVGGRTGCECSRWPACSVTPAAGRPASSGPGLPPPPPWFWPRGPGVNCAACRGRKRNNGVGLKPAMGWSSWSFLRHEPDRSEIEAQARAMVTSGLAKVGYRYVNLDDFWYICPGSGAKGGPLRPVGAQPRCLPARAAWEKRHPGRGQLRTQPGTEVRALRDARHLQAGRGRAHAHIGRQWPALGVHRQRNRGRPSFSEYNYNCGGMVGINYKAPGAQEFINSWADEFARWGIDYLKLDGVGSFDIPDVRAWSTGCARREADPSRAFQQPEHPLRLDMGAVLQRVAHRQRHRVLLVRDQRLQLPAHGLRQR